MLLIGAVIQTVIHLQVVYNSPSYISHTSSYTDVIYNRSSQFSDCGA
jgi:hypothetical protein